jgi:hypothetical protein
MSRVRVEIAGKVVQAVQLGPSEGIWFGTPLPGSSDGGNRLQFLDWPGAERLEMRTVDGTLHATWFLTEQWRELPMPDVLAKQRITVRALLVPERIPVEVAIPARGVRVAHGS